MGETAANRVTEGRSATFQNLYVTHGPEILAYFKRRLSAADAQDAAADVFEVAWRRFGDVPAGDEAVRFLFGIARNVLSNRLRTSRRGLRLDARLRSLGESTATGPEMQLVRRHEDEQVLAALMALPEKYREPLLLTEWEGLSRQDVAAVYGISKNAVDQRISRACRRLGRTLGAAGLGSDFGRRSPLDTEKGALE